MKILYLHQYFNTPDMNGGTRSYDMPKRFVKAGHEVHIITSKRSGASKNNGWTKEEIDGVFVHWLPVKYDNKMNYIRRIFSFLQFALKAGNKAKKIGGDIVFATSTPLTIAIPAIKAKKKLQIPMVFEVRDLWPELPIAVGAIKSPILIYLAKKLELWAYKNSSHIIGLSPGMCQGVVNTGYPKEKVHIIPNSCDIKLFKVDKNEENKFRARHDWLQDRPLVLYAGTLGIINGVSFLAEIAGEMLKINPEIRFLVVGTGKEEEKVRTKAKELGVYKKNFYMFPPVSKKEIPVLLSAATISTSLFIPLKEMWANSANKFFDTLAASKPIAINYGGWQKEIIESKGIGVVLDDNNSHLAALKLNSFISDKKAIDAARTSSEIVAKTEFSRDLLADKLIKVLEDTITNSPLQN